MDVWILRYPVPRKRVSASREVTVLQRAEDGEETELEVVVVEATKPTLQDAVREQIEKGHPRLILDLIHELHMDSSYLSQIIGAHKQAKESGGELVLANPNARIQEILRITRLEEVITAFDSLEAAAQHLAPR